MLRLLRAVFHQLAGRVPRETPDVSTLGYCPVCLWPSARRRPPYLTMCEGHTDAGLVRYALSRRDRGGARRWGAKPLPLAWIVVSSRPILGVFGPRMVLTTTVADPGVCCGPGVYAVLAVDAHPFGSLVNESWLRRHAVLQPGGGER